MKELSRKARAYLIAVVACGVVLLAFYLDRAALDLGQSILLLAAILIASVAQLLKVQGPTATTSYNLGLVMYGFGFVMFGSRGAILIAVCASAVEWLWHKYPWFIQSFNICALIVDVTAAGAVYGWVSRGSAASSLLGVVGLVAAAAAFVFLNHLMVGIMIYLGRGDGFSETGILGFMTLAMDVTLFGIGIVAALLWHVSPFAAVIAFTPLYLLATTLRMPSLQRQAVTDSKTGLFNARYFQEALTRELVRANRYDRPLTLVVGDLDLLRNINNTYGHLAGDDVLVAVAQLMKAHFRDCDVVARFGGEEFAVLMPETPLHEAAARVEALRRAIEEAEIEVQTSVMPIRVTMSFGLAECGPEDVDGPALLHRADVAVYHAKRDGRNRVRLAPPRPQDGTVLGLSNAEPDCASMVTQALPAPDGPPGGASEHAGTDESLRPAGPDRGEPVPPAMPRHSAKWTIPLYVTVVGLVAVAAIIVTLRTTVALPAAGSWPGIVLFFIIAVLAESLSIDIYTRDTSVSTSAAPFIAGTLLFGPFATMAMSVGVAVAAMVKHHSPPSRLVFNTSSHLLAGLACLWVSRLTGFPTDGQAPWLQLGASIACGVVLFAVTTGSVAGAISLSVGDPVTRVWYGQFRWVAPYYLGLGALASGLVLSFEYAGLAGVVAVTVPLLILRYAQKQYLDHTKSSVSQLRENNAELVFRAAEIEELNEELLQVLSNVIDLRDPSVLGHSKYVSRYATLIAQEMGLPLPTVEMIRRAGLLHDIGKLGISEDVLQKPARLTASEYETVKAHAELAGVILRDCKSLAPLTLIVRHHHECFDGSGYPAGLSGNSIPLESRILAVADAVEAMASDRPYRRGSTAAAIVQELKNKAGTQFDPAAVDAMCRLVRREGTDFILNSSSEAGMNVGPLIPNREEKRIHAVRVARA